MRPIHKPPDIFDPARLVKLFTINGSGVQAFVAKANRAYYHWEELRRRPLPAALTPEDAWAIVKSSRALSRTPLPLQDADGRPFTYWLPDSAYKILHNVDRQGGGTFAASADDQAILDEMRDRVLIDSLMEEAIATSQIEGAVTTRKVAKELLRTGRKPRDKSEQMIVNGYRTIQLLRGRIQQPLSIELIHEIQESMTRDTLENEDDAGRFRTEQDQVRIIDSRDGQVVFQPPPAEQLEQRMKKLIDFANAPLDAEPFVHPLVRATILHFWLAYEHPYIDGNGRTARALFYWNMLKSGYWLFEFLTISRIILASPMRYYRSFLYSETDDNDLTYFLISQFDVARKALEDLHRRLQEMRDQQARMQSLKLARQLNPRQRALLDHALRHPHQIYTIESHQHSHGVSYETARSDLLLLVARGLLAEVGGRRPRQFAPSQNLSRKVRSK